MTAPPHPLQTEHPKGRAMRLNFQELLRNPDTRRVRLSMRSQPRNAPFRETARRLRRSGKVHFTERRTLSVERRRKAQSVPHASRKGAPCDPQIAHTAPLRHVTAHRRLWGQPPARLRGTVKNGPTGQMRSRNPPLGCGADRTRVRKPGLEFGLTERRTLRWTSHGKGALWPSRLS